MATLTAFHNGVGPGSCSSVRRMSSISPLSMVNSRGSTWTRNAKLPIRALSAGISRSMNAWAARRTSRKFSRMLTLRSSIITTVMGWMSLANVVIVWRLPLS
jgi:hypothetical protein